MPELRRRFCRAADPACKGMAPRVVGREASTVGQARALSYSLDDLAAHSARIRNIPPEER